MFDLTGKLTYMVGFTAEGHPIITFELNEKMPALQMVDELHNEEKLTIKVSKATKKRSLDANSYYWLLLGRLSKALKISNPHCHNLMLRRYGVDEDFDGQVAYWVLPDTEEAERKANEAETYHIRPTSQVQEGKDGVMYRTYILLKGSHDYSREEFTALLEGLIDECRHVGIETKCQEDIDSLLSQYGVSK